MTTEQFAYWLKGHIELNLDPKTPPTQAQWEMVQQHLDLVFDKVTPPLKGLPFPCNLPSHLLFPPQTTSRDSETKFC